MADSILGRELAGFRIEALIGRGGMGRVYRAIQLDLGRPVALKVLSPDLSDDADFRQRFVHESRVAASIDHPNVLPIYDAGEVDGILYIAMRYVEGSDLRALIQREAPLSTQRVLGFLRQAASALDAAHQRGLVHRDVKPGNFLITEEHVYLTDFGIAREMAADRGMTRTNAFIGTLDYASPEQIRHEPLDARSDLYALACVFFECLVGSPPFDRPTEHAVMQAHLNDLPPSLRTFRPELPSALDDVFAVALAKMRDERYRTGRHFTQAFQAAAIAQPAIVSVTPLELRETRITVAPTPPPREPLLVAAAPSATPPIATPPSPAPRSATPPPPSEPRQEISLVTERTFPVPRRCRVVRHVELLREPWPGSEKTISIRVDELVLAIAEAREFIHVRRSTGEQGWLAEADVEWVADVPGYRSPAAVLGYVALAVTFYFVLSNLSAAGGTTAHASTAPTPPVARTAVSTPSPDLSAAIRNNQVQQVAQQRGWQTHTVLYGETVYSIADVARVPRSTLMSANLEFYPDIQTTTPPVGSVLLMPAGATAAPTR